jgi:hypothetical protein
MDISRAGTARAAAAAGQRLGAVDRTAASLLRSGMVTRATPSSDDGKTKTDDDPDATGQGEDASAADKKSDDDDTKVDAKSDDDAKEDAAEDREEEKASDKKKIPNAVDREGDAPSLKDKESLLNDDLTETPWDDKKREIAPPIDHEEDDTPVQKSRVKTGLAAEDTIDDMMSREFSYDFTTDSDEKIPEPTTQKNMPDDHNYLNTVSDVSFDSTPDEERGLLDGGDNEPGPLPSGDATDVEEQRGHFDGSENDPGPLSSGQATPVEDLEKTRAADDDDETPSTPSGAMAGVPAS